jgi:hypothetical protein
MLAGCVLATIGEVSVAAVDFVRCSSSSLESVVGLAIDSGCGLVYI